MPSKMRHRGRYVTRKQFLKPRMQVLAFMGVFTLMPVCLSISAIPTKFDQDSSMLVQPKNQPPYEFFTTVRAIEPTPNLATPVPTSIEDKIREKFGENAEAALKIATCESGIRAEAVGDKNLTFVKDGVTYGTSHGVFQIRYLKGRPEPTELHDVDTNIDIAFKMSNGGTHWKPWYNCMRRAL